MIRPLLICEVEDCLHFEFLSAQANGGESGSKPCPACGAPSLTRAALVTWPDVEGRNGEYVRAELFAALAPPAVRLDAPLRDYSAKSVADLVTPKQLGMIRALAREAGVDPDEKSREFCQGQETMNLSKRGASLLIDRLKDLTAAKG